MACVGTKKDIVRKEKSTIAVINFGFTWVSFKYEIKSLIVIFYQNKTKWSSM